MHACERENGYNYLRGSSHNAKTSPHRIFADALPLEAMEGDLVSKENTCLHNVFQAAQESTKPSFNFLDLYPVVPISVNLSPSLLLLR